MSSSWLHNVAGLNLEMMGQARTYMNLALVEGLRRAGVKYTLPPIQGTVGTYADMELHMRKHYLQSAKAPDSESGPSAAQSSAKSSRAGDETSAAAAQGILMS